MKSSMVTTVKKNVLKGVAAVFMVCALVGLMACSSSKQENAQQGTTSSSDSSYTLVTKGHLTVVAELGFQPFEYFEGNSTTPVGFDVDLITEIAKDSILRLRTCQTRSLTLLFQLLSRAAKQTLLSQVLPSLTSALRR